MALSDQNSIDKIINQFTLLAMVIPPLALPIVTTSRVAQISGHLQRLINAGLLQAGQRLPTERELAVQLGVSAPTVNKAMAMLEAGGYLVRRVGAGTSVAPNVGLGAIAIAFFAHSIERGPLFYRALLGRLSQRIAAAGYQPEAVLTPVGPDRAVDRSQLIRAIERGRMVGVISVGGSDELVKVAAARNVGVITFGLTAHSTCGFHLDYQSLVNQSVDHLVERGHRRIAMMTHEQVNGLAGHRRDFLAALARHGIDGGPTITDLRDPLTIVRAIQGLLSASDRPSALLVADENLLPAITMGAALQGATIPADLAVISHASLGLEPEGLVTFTRCGFDVDDLADRLVERVLASIAGAPTTGPSIAPPVRLVQGTST